MADDKHQSPAPLAEITHAPSGFEQFLDKNQKGLVVGLAVLVLGVLGFIVYSGLEDSKRLSASHALYAAEDESALKQVISEHSGTPSAGTAQLLLAQRQSENDEPGSAVETLGDFIESANEHPAVPAAIASLAAKKMNQGDAAEASKLFEGLLDNPRASYLAPYALLCLGDMAASAGDQGKAEQFYQQAKTEYPTSGFLTQVNQRLAGLNAVLPEEIEAPAEPAPAGGTEVRLPNRPSPLLPDQPDSSGVESDAPSPDAGSSELTVPDDSPSGSETKAPATGSSEESTSENPSSEQSE